MSAFGDALDAAMQPHLGGVKTEYRLNIVSDLTSHPSWPLTIPWWMTEEQGRDLAITLRDALRARGFDCRLTAATTLVDEVP